jgi:GNAT superfamily N-acetyltransferase
MRVQGELRVPAGGATAEPRDLQLMAAGFEARGVNSGDVTGPDPDLDAAREFYGARGVTWGLRVPCELPWPHGRRLFRRRVMAMPRAAFVPAPAADGLTLRPAGPADLPAVLHIDSTVFDLDPVDNTRWLEPLLAAEVADVALATLDGEPAGTAYTLRSEGAGGPALCLAGLAVLPHARRRGVGAALSSWLLERGFAAGAELAHLNPDTDEAARLYERLGFTETPGLDVYVDI